MQQDTEMRAPIAPAKIIITAGVDLFSFEVGSYSSTKFKSEMLISKSINESSKLSATVTDSIRSVIIISRTDRSCKVKLN